MLPLDRAMMRLKVESSSKDAKKLKEKFVALASSVESENWESGEITLVLKLIIYINNYFSLLFYAYVDDILQILLIDPGNYRQIDELIRTDTKGTTSMEVLSLKEVIEGDSFLD